MAKSKNDNINISIFTALKVSEISKVPVLIMSNPGLGKSTSVEMFAEVRDYHLTLLRGNSTSPEEVLGFDVFDNTIKDAKSTKHLRPTWFAEILEVAEKGGKTLLFLDEITTCHSAIQAALLHLVFERKVGSERLPEDTLIVSAGNYAQNLSNSMEMLPPLMNRFMIFNITPDHTDLDTFLCKFDGAIASSEGKIKDFMGNLKETMKKLDAQEVDIPKDQYNKIGEYIERGIKQTARALMISGSKPVDLSITDLNGIYADAENETKLYGFTTFRTLNYLRDVTIASFKCFGKSGITSDNYRNMIDGLCGIGISRDPKTKNIVKTPISKDFYDTMVNIVNDIEKMKNDKLPKYTKFFNEIVDGKKKFEVPEMQAVINKLSELKADKDLENIERPIDPACIEKLCKLSKDSGSSITKIKVSTTDKFLDKVPTETFIGYVSYWNTLSDLMTSLQSLISDSTKGYKDDTMSLLKNTQEDLRTSGFKLRSIRKIILQEDPSMGSLIPDIRSFK
nr:MAG TPA: MoxR-like ATPase [Bacteriophage sp.]